MKTTRLLNIIALVGAAFVSTHCATPQKSAVAQPAPDASAVASVPPPTPAPYWSSNKQISDGSVPNDQPPVTSASTAASPASSADAAALKPIKMVIVGDSTVCIFPDSDRTHRHGWGMHIQDYFKNDLTVSDDALSGRSTKTFIQEGAWDKALAEKPDIVLIQFGHNDSHAPTAREATDAATDFRDYLRKYIDDTRAIGGVPILVTPMQRRAQADNLAPYADAMKAVAAEKNVALIDLHDSSGKLYEKLGPAGIQELEATADGVTFDHTHFNAKGAIEMAKLVMVELPTAAPQLKPYLKPPPATN